MSLGQRLKWRAAAPLNNGSTEHENQQTNMNLHLAPVEDDVVAHCLSCYMDNEGSKGGESIGTDQMDLVQDALLSCADGLRDGPLELELRALAHLRAALETYGPDSSSEAAASGLADRIDVAFDPRRIAGCAPQDAQEARIAAYCLSAYLDNESDKGREGIGTDQSGLLVPLIERYKVGPSAEGLDLLTLAHLQAALDMHSDAGGPEDVEQLISAMLGRIALVEEAGIPPADNESEAAAPAP